MITWFVIQVVKHITPKSQRVRAWNRTEVWIIGLFILFNVNDPFLSDSTPQFIESQRGHKLILLSGYKYYVKKCKILGNNITKKRWACSTHVARGCKAFIHTIEDEIVSLNTDHNHEPASKQKKYEYWILYTVVMALIFLEWFFKVHNKTKDIFC